MLSAPGGAMLDSKLFVSRLDGFFPDLYERWWDGDEWIWVDHGRPQGIAVTGIPGAAMLNEKVFVRIADGAVWERNWRGDISSWVWTPHGRPGNRAVIGGPAAAMMGIKFFVGADDGHMYERFWNGNQWVWVDHGSPPGTTVSTAPGAAMMDSKLFIGAANGHMYERFWNGNQWVWVNHGTARHDDAQHVVGAPGPEPKLTIAVMGDGFAEGDLGSYDQLVQGDVLRALRSDQLGNHQAALRVVRINVVSVDTGVRERRYDNHGNITSDVYRESRLGVIPNDDWDRCWFDFSSYTTRRIEKLRRRFAPDADHIIVLVNSPTWGGCSSVGPGNGFFTRAGGWVVIAHECGHNLFQLDDEYVKGNSTFIGTRASANTSEQPANWSTLKWSALVAAGASLPTDPAHLPGAWNRRTSVGAFEGAGGSYSHGLFRPVLECRMNQNDPPWCPVCGRKIDSDLAVFA
jgi:hypothetical protein